MVDCVRSNGKIIFVDFRAKRIQASGIERVCKVLDISVLDEEQIKLVHGDSYVRDVLTQLLISRDYGMGVDRLYHRINPFNFGSIPDYGSIASAIYEVANVGFASFSTFKRTHSHRDRFRLELEPCFYPDESKGIELIRRLWQHNDEDSYRREARR